MGEFFKPLNAQENRNASRRKNMINVSKGWNENQKNLTLFLKNQKTFVNRNIINRGIQL